MFAVSVINLQTSSTERSITTPFPSTLVMSATLQLQGSTGNVSAPDGASICDLCSSRRRVDLRPGRALGLVERVGVCGDSAGPESLQGSGDVPQKPRLVEGTTQAGEWRTRRQIGDYFRRRFGPVLASLERRRARSALSLVGPYPAGRGCCRISDRGYRCGVWYLADAGQSILFYRGTYPVGSRATGDHQWAIRNRATSRLCGLRAGIGRQRDGSQFAALDHPGGDHGGCCCPSNGNRGPDASKRISRIS